MTQVLQIISDTNIGGGGRSLLNYLAYQDKSRFCSRVVLPRGSALKPRLEQMGIEVFEIDAMADKSMDPKALAPLCRLIHHTEPDLVHTHGSLTGRIAARLCGKKTVYTKHCAFPPGRLQASLPGRMAGRLLDTCLSDGVIAVGDSAMDILTRCGIPENKIHVLFNGVAPLPVPTAQQRMQLRADLGFAPEDFVVGILARVEEYKGHTTLFDAAEQLRLQGRRVCLLVAGEGSMEDDLRRRAQAAAPESVCFTGFVRDVEQVLGAMDVQVNASTVSETSSLSLLEGMSMGLPAVVSDVGGNPLLIEKGKNGLVFPVGDSAALAGCIARLMDEPDTLQAMSAGAQEIFCRRFTAEIYARNMERVYQTVLEGKKHE